MTRHGRALCSIHGALGIWLAYCAVQSGRNGVAWAVILFAAASLVPVISVIRETELADVQRGVAIRAERETHPRLPDAIERHLADAIDQAAAVALAAACCEIWWTSTGREHEDACPKNDHRSAA
jgi:hypothetical protein